MQDLKAKAHDMYCKYIKVGSELEINLSYGCRMRVAAVLDDLNMLYTMHNVSLHTLFHI